MEATSSNFETAAAIMAFVEANRDGRYDDLIARGKKFLKGIQWDDEEGHDKSSLYYGGAGYGSRRLATPLLRRCLAAVLVVAGAKLVLA